MRNQRSGSFIWFILSIKKRTISFRVLDMFRKWLQLNARATFIAFSHGFVYIYLWVARVSYIYIRNCVIKMLLLLFCSNACLNQANAVDGLHHSWNRSVTNCMTVPHLYHFELSTYYNIIIRLIFADRFDQYSQ